MKEPKPSRYTLVILAALFAWAPVVGQEAQSADTADFENALFGDASAEGSGAGPAAGSTAGPVAGPNGASAEIARTEYLVGGTAVVRALGTWNGEETTTRAGLEGRVFAKVSFPESGALFIAYNAALPTFQGYSGDGPVPSAKDTYQPSYSLAELHYSFDIAKVVFLRLGNQLIAWGPSRIWTPVDFINQERVDAFADLDTRVGKPGFRVHVPLRGGNLFGFADFSSLASGGSYGDPAKKVRIGGRGDFTAGGFEFGLTAYGGRGTMPRFGADASGRAFGTTLYGEYAITTRTDGAPTTQASAGFLRSLDELRRWTLSAEGFYNSSGKDLGGYDGLSFQTLPEEERTPLYQGRWYVYAALQGDKFLSPSLSTTLSATVNLSDRSYLVKASEAFSFPRSVPFTLDLAYAGGGEDREFTRFVGDGAITATLSTKLEF